MKKTNCFKLFTSKAVAMLLVIMTIASAFAVSVSAAASWPAVSSSAYCEFTAAKTIYVYRNTACTTRGTLSPAKSYNAYIASGDVCRIIEFGSSYIKLQYPTSSGYKTAYIKRGDLLGVSAPTEAVTSNGKVTTYTKAGGSSYGYVAGGDKVYACGTSGSYTAVIYQAKSGSRAYKLGYVTTDNYNSVIKKQQTQTAAASGWRLPMDNAYCTWRSYSDMSWASYTSTGSGRNYHLGIDIYGSNSNVYAASDGTVVACSSSNSGANGRFIVIQHNLNGKTIYSFYAHLSSLNVSKGQYVSKGTKIASAGGSGYGNNQYYGTHLHFAIMDKLNSNGSYYGYATYFTGNKVTYSGTTFYNPVYVINNNKLP